MTPAARVQAAIEILDQVIVAARGNGPPADRIVSEWFKTRRFAGSKDRRAVRDLVYLAIRSCGDIPPSGRAAMLRLAQLDPAIALLFDGSIHGPAPVEAGEPVAPGGTAPPWMEERLSVSGIDGPEAAALLDRAPLDVRINTLQGCLLVPPEGGEPIPHVNGMRYPYGTRIEDSEAFRDGVIEVQDAGSQLACLAVAAPENSTVIDLCAGAGGKSLALAAQVGTFGKVIACDTDRGRLSRLPARSMRAGADSIIETRLLDPGKEAHALADWTGRADAVLVDAPCSGTGTWRRSPDARWRITERDAGQQPGGGLSQVAQASAGVLPHGASGGLLGPGLPFLRGGGVPQSQGAAVQVDIGRGGERGHQSGADGLHGAEPADRGVGSRGQGDGGQEDGGHAGMKTGQDQDVSRGPERGQGQDADADCPPLPDAGLTPLRRVGERHHADVDHHEDDQCGGDELGGRQFPAVAPGHEQGHDGSGQRDAPQSRHRHNGPVDGGAGDEEDDVEHVCLEGE